MMTTPEYLAAGDRIAIVAPAGKITQKTIDSAAAMLKSWGLEVVLGKYLFRDAFQYSATDNERLSDLQEALDDPSIKAILCARGGYGTVRIIDRINFDRFKQAPKWIIGFSDITVLHAHIHSNLGTETIHAAMAAGMVTLMIVCAERHSSLTGKHASPTTRTSSGACPRVAFGTAS